MNRSSSFDPRTVVLPKGTRVVLRQDVPGDAGYLHRAASVAVVDVVAYGTYHLVTPSGRRFTAERDQIAPQREELLAELGARQWDFARLERGLLFATTVGSRAWGLDHADSDEDVRGAFMAPFGDFAGLWTLPQEIHDPTHTHAYWEIGRFVTQGLRGDANTLESLWSPLVVHQTPLGEVLCAERGMFVSMNVLGSFGRYAQSQFKKIERTLVRNRAQDELLNDIAAGRVVDKAGAVAALASLGGGEKARLTELTAILRSLADRGHLPSADFEDLLSAVAEVGADILRPPTHRPKNAYNLLRLLYSCQHWLTEGAPLIRVEGSRRDTLLAIKDQRMAIEDTLRLAKEAAEEVESLAATARLPAAPDYTRADALLRRCRRAAARRVVAVSSEDETEAPTRDDYSAELAPVSLPADVDVDRLRRFLSEQLQAARARARHPLWVGLTGAHAYGFPSPDSDLDLKGLHTATAADLLAQVAEKPSHDVLIEWEGREYDYTTAELGPFAARLLKGNGNALEQLLGPYPVLTTDAGSAVAAWAAKNVCQKSVEHYRGFLRGVLREYAREAGLGTRKAKRLLYGYRVALTGLHLLATGELEMNVTHLAEGRWPGVAELLAVKTRAELGTLAPDQDDRPYLEDLERLDAALAVAPDTSPLPPTPPDEEGLRRLLVALRL